MHGQLLTLWLGMMVNGSKLNGGLRITPGGVRKQSRSQAVWRMPSTLRDKIEGVLDSSPRVPRYLSLPKGQNDRERPGHPV